jgi:hypothetical protein
MSEILLIIKDETAAGKSTGEVQVRFTSELVSVKEIIISRVTVEVEAYNNKLPEYFNGLIQPSEAEKTINGFKLEKKRKIDAEKQCYTALDAFNKNAYFVLIDNIQAESLEQMILINKHTEISFVKLTPLVGG